MAYRHNIAVLALTRWAKSDVPCAGAALRDLRVAQSWAVSRQNSDMRDLAQRTAFFVRLCRQEISIDEICAPSYNIAGLSYLKPEQDDLEDSIWFLVGYWVDMVDLELNRPVTIALKWQTSYASLLEGIPEGQIVFLYDDVGNRWCLRRDGDDIFQAATVHNLIREAGFETSLLPALAFPWYYIANTNNGDLLRVFSVASMDRDGSSINSVCIEGNHTDFDDRFGPGLYSHIHVVPRQKFLQGATVITVGEGKATLGGVWETEQARISQYVITRKKTNDGWVSYAQLVIAPSKVNRFNFRLSNWGEAGYACFDDVFILPIVYPNEIRSDHPSIIPMR